MAFQSVWYYTDLPEDIVDIIERDVSETFDEQMGDSKLHGDALNKEKRNSQNAWIPTTHWVGGFLWHYIQRANRENFLYDLRCIDGESMQYTRYGEGQFYGWHNDADFLFREGPPYSQRKLSCSIILKEAEEGGIFETQHGTGDFDQKAGSIFVFPSFYSHQVTPIIKGERISIVTWTCGPEWR